MSILGYGFRYYGEIIAPDGTVETFEASNLLPQVSINHIAGLIRGSGSPIASWYLGLFENNYVPTSGVTSADIPGVVGECTAYDAATRPLWVNAFDGFASIDNLSNRVTFEMNTPKTVYGAFIVSSNVKAGNSGLLLSIARFNTAKVLDAGTQFSLAAGITLIPTS